METGWEARGALEAYGGLHYSLTAGAAGWGVSSNEKLLNNIMSWVGVERERIQRRGRRKKEGNKRSHVATLEQGRGGSPVLIDGLF